MKRFLCAFLLICVLFCPLALFTSCGNDTVFSLGPYEIKEDHYRYLASIYNRQILASNGMESASYDTPLSESGMTVGSMIDLMYTDKFLTNVFTPVCE